VTGSTKASLIAHDCKFDFSAQTQSFINTLSNFKISHPGLSSLFLLAIFLSPMATLQAVWELGQPGVGCVWLYSFAVLNNDLHCNFFFILVSFEP